MRPAVVLFALLLAPLSTSSAPEGATDPTIELLVSGSPEDAAAAGLTVLREVGFGWTLVVGPAAVTSEVSAIRTATDTGLIVEPNVVFDLADEPLFPDQWSLENTGQSGGSADADVDALRAWEFTIGSPSVVVAVLDTGVALAHPDLASRIWANTDEVGGNGLDDDGNGWVDDTRGGDAVDNDADPADGDGHGTFVASTAAAAVNGVGMAGVAPGARVMPIRVCTGSGCSLADIVTGLSYAVANGADVANLSFGGNISPPVSMETAIRTAVDTGMVVVAAAGNSGGNNDLLPNYPSGFDIDGLIAVAATDRNDELAGFSNFGSVTVDLAAPGQDVIGGIPPNSWTTGSGTSFSTPMVSGIAALIRTTRPDLDPAAIAALITESVDVLPSLSGRVATSGRLNAGSALVLATTPVAVVKATPSNAVLPVTIRLDGSGSFDPWGSIVTRSWTLPDGSSGSGTSVEWTPKRPGTYRATLTVVDDSGLKDTATVSVIVSLRPGGSFIDDDGHFGERVSEASKAEGITLGCDPPANDRFCPDDPVTRGEMAAFLARALKLPITGLDHFIDDDGSVFEGAIDRIASARITVGCNPPSNTRYCPDRAVTRAEMAAFLVRAFDLPSAGSGAFVDDEGVYESAIDRRAGARISTGCNPPTNDRFCPDQAVTRAEMAVFLARALDLAPITPTPR